MSIQEKSEQEKAYANYAKVKLDIESDRLHPWSSAPTFTIGGFDVSPLTLRTQCDLTLAGNAIVCGTPMSEGDIAVYIWRHHADFGDESKRKKFIKQISEATNAEQIIKDCIEHCESAYMDTPNGQSFGGTSRSNAMPSIPTIAMICDEYGSAYGVDPREVADIDLRIVFQACRAIRSRLHGTKYTEPKQLREAKSEILKANG